MAYKRSNSLKHIAVAGRKSGGVVKRLPVDERARQLADIAANGNEDSADCAAADLAREFPSAAP